MSKLVHKRIIQKELVDKMEASVVPLGDVNDHVKYPSYGDYLDKYRETLESQVIERELKMARAYCDKKYPEAVRRVGCYCCYPDGPDLEIMMPSKQADGSMVIECYVDYDFKKSDYATEDKEV
jgi:hypothetical protein